MAPSAPTLHTFDPEIAGKVGLYIDAPASYDQVIWYCSLSSGSGMTEVAVTWDNLTLGLDGLTLVVDAPKVNGTPVTSYWEAKLHDSTGYGALSPAVQVTPSAGPPPPPPAPTAQQDLEAAIGQTVNVGDQIALYPQPSVVKTVQADGSLA